MALQLVPAAVSRGASSVLCVLQSGGELIPAGRPGWPASGARPAASRRGRSKQAVRRRLVALGGSDDPCWAAAGEVALRRRQAVGGLAGFELTQPFRLPAGTY